MITIDYLKHHPQHVQTLAELWLDTIGKTWAPDVTIEDSIKRFQSHLNTDTLPLTFIALDNNTPVGMCSLRSTDSILRNLSPWLGSLVVNPKHQNQGIGKMLINATQDKARQFGFKNLYLFTFDPTLPNYYTQLGWNMIETAELHGNPITVMDIQL